MSAPYDRSASRDQAEEKIKYWKGKLADIERSEADFERELTKAALLEKIEELIVLPPITINGTLRDAASAGLRIMKGWGNDLLQGELEKLPLGIELEVTIKVTGPFPEGYTAPYWYPNKMSLSQGQLEVLRDLLYQTKPKTDQQHALYSLVFGEEDGS